MLVWNNGIFHFHRMQKRNENEIKKTRKFVQAFIFFFPHYVLKKNNVGNWLSKQKKSSILVTRLHQKVFYIARAYRWRVVLIILSKHLIAPNLHHTSRNKLIEWIHLIPAFSCRPHFNKSSPAIFLKNKTILNLY